MYRQVSPSDINPNTGKQYALNPEKGWTWDDNYFSYNYGGDYTRRNGGRYYGEDEGSFQQRRAAEQAEAQRVEAERIRVENERKQSELAAAQKLERDNKFAADKAELGAFNDRYKAGTQQTYNDVYGKYDIAGQTAVVNELRDKIMQMQTGIGGGANSGYASAGRTNKAISAKWLPQFNSAVANLTTSINSGQTEYDAKVKPWETEASMLNDRMAREMTGFDNGQQRELDGLLTTLKINGDLTTAQWAQANALAEAALAYKSKFEEIAAQERLANREMDLKQQEIDSSRYISIGNDSYLFDTKTGQIVMNPKSDSNKNPYGYTAVSTSKPTTKPSASPTSQPTTQKKSLDELYKELENITYKGKPYNDPKEAGGSATLR